MAFSVKLFIRAHIIERLLTNCLSALISTISDVHQRHAHNAVNKNKQLTTDTENTYDRSYCQYNFWHHSRISKNCRHGIAKITISPLTTAFSYEVKIPTNNDETLHEFYRPMHPAGALSCSSRRCVDSLKRASGQRSPFGVLMARCLHHKPDQMYEDQCS